MKQRRTMQDVADAAGVSRMTVSLALRNSPTLKPGTRERICAIASEIGYTPDPMVQKLTTHLSQCRRKQCGLVIAWIDAMPSRHGWKDVASFRAMHEGASAAAKESGFHLEDFWLKEPGMSGAKLSNILYQRGIERLIIAPLPHGAGHLTLKWERFSVIALGHSLKAPQLHRVTNYQLHSIRTATRQLTRRGCQRIGLCLDKNHDKAVDHSWTIGMAHHHSMHQPNMRVPPYISTHWDPAAMGDWVRSERVDAVLTCYFQFPEILQTHCPDLAGKTTVAMLDWPGGAPGLPGIDQRNDEVGRAAVEQVIGQANRNEKGIPKVPKLVMIEGAWTDGLP